MNNVSLLTYRSLLTVIAHYNILNFVIIIPMPRINEQREGADEFFHFSPFSNFIELN